VGKVTLIMDSFRLLT